MRSDLISVSDFHDSLPEKSFLRMIVFGFIQEILLAGESNECKEAGDGDLIINGLINRISVITTPVELATLPHGYYMRFVVLDEGKQRFHLYGIEVKKNKDVVVHENIPRNNINGHKDIEFKEQLLQLHSEGNVKFYLTKFFGGGIRLHGEIAKEFAEKGEVIKERELQEEVQPASIRYGFTYGQGASKAILAQKSSNKDGRTENQPRQVISNEATPLIDSRSEEPGGKAEEQKKLGCPCCIQ